MENGDPTLCVGMFPPAEDSTRKLARAPAEMVNGVLAAGVRPDDDAVSAFDPVRLMLRSGNLARPVVSVSCASVPLSVPVPVEREILTVSPAVLTLFPEASFNWTVTAGVIVAPATALVGSWT